MMARKVLYILLLLPALMYAACLSAQSRVGHVAILGDSNTWLGGDDCSQRKGWTYWFCQSVRPASCHSYARSGATWTNTPRTVRDTEENIGSLGDNNVIYNQALRLIEAYEHSAQPTQCAAQPMERSAQPAPDIIIIAAGTNDAWFNAKRPEAFKREANDELSTLPVSKILTLEGAVMSNCRLLQRHFPKARLVLLTPMQTTAADDKLIHKAGDIIAECATRLGADVIRQDTESKVVSAKERRHHHYTYDGTHTSEAGARANGEMIAKQLKLAVAR